MMVLGVSGAWLLIGLVWASQVVLGGTMQGSPVAAGAAISSSLVQTLPWIPVTLVVVHLAIRFPVTARSWRRTVPIHVLAFIVAVYLENVLVVLGFWMTQGMFNGIPELLRQGGRWAVLRAHIAALVYIAIAATTQMIGYYRATRARELHVARLEGQLARARLDALNAQIRPHFLFNTLHTIGQLWRSGRADDADAMLDHLGSLFQRVRQSASQPLVRLDEELDMVRAYLAIEQTRFRDRLEISVDVGDGAHSCGVPPLLLQPLVENAVRHGIAASSVGRHVDVMARRDGGRLVLMVEDDGPGLDHASDQPGSGTGLTNTRQRLDQLFGSDHQFDIGPRAPRGTAVRIEIPATMVEDDATVADTRTADLHSRQPRS